jgi:adenine deaminase
VIDPHEIANVAGVAGIRFMAAVQPRLPLQRGRDGLVVRAGHAHGDQRRHCSTQRTWRGLLDEGAVHGLAEVMNFPGVINGDASVLAKLAAFRGRPQDGHAPAHRQALNAYVAVRHRQRARMHHRGRSSARKLARGLYILIREATNAHNLHALLPLITRTTAGASASAPTTASPPT